MHKFTSEEATVKSQAVPGPYHHKLGGPFGLMDVVHSIAQSISIETVIDRETDKLERAFIAFGQFVKDSEVGVYVSMTADQAEQMGNSLKEVASKMREIEKSGELPESMREAMVDWEDDEALRKWREATSREHAEEEEDERVVN